jgi:hypothetical protein
MPVVDVDIRALTDRQRSYSFTTHVVSPGFQAASLLSWRGNSGQSLIAPGCAPAAMVSRQALTYCSSPLWFDQDHWHEL